MGIEKVKLVEEYLNEASMSRILHDMDTHDIATITSYVTEDNDARIVTPKRRTNKANKAMLKKLSSDLRALKYGFIRVEGEWIPRGSASAVGESSFFVINPEGGDLETFTRDMKNLARKYEQESVIVWNHINREGILYGTDDFITYNQWAVFKDYKINDKNAQVWTRFNNHWFEFTEDIPITHGGSHVTEDVEVDYSNPVHPYRISHNRDVLFGEWY